MPTAPKPGINYNKTSSGTDIPHLPDWAEKMLSAYLKQAGLDRCFINSTTRTVESQVGAMYDNEKAGNHIKYGKPGQAIISLINQMGFTRPKSEVVAAAAKLMRQQFAANGSVSYHVAEFKPDGFEAADISPVSVQAKYSKLLEVLDAAKKRGELKELIYPPNDPALHVVFVRDKSSQVIAATEHVVTGGNSATYEGGADESDHAKAVAALGGGGLLMLLGGAGLVWWLMGRNKPA